MTEKQIRTNRRLFLRQSAASVFAAGLWPGARTARAAAGNAKAEPFNFAVVNDTHYRDQRCGDYLTQAFRQIRAERRKPEFILLAGDLATDGRPNELGSMVDILSAVKCPVHVTPGNHDYEPDQSGKAYDTLFPQTAELRGRTQGLEHLVLRFNSARAVARGRRSAAYLGVAGHHAAEAGSRAAAHRLHAFPPGRRRVDAVDQCGIGPAEIREAQPAGGIHGPLSRLDRKAIPGNTDLHQPMHVVLTRQS